MSTFELDQNDAAYQIRAYLPGTIQVNEQKYTKSLILSANQLIEDWQPQSVKELSAEHFAPILKLTPDIVLIGTGATHILIPPSIYSELINNQIGIEVMSTSAAARTFNALTSEHRNVVAALLIR